MHKDDLTVHSLKSLICHKAKQNQIIYIYIYICVCVCVCVCVLELRNRNTFEPLQEKTEKSTPINEYENFVKAHLEAAAKCFPTKPRTKYRVP